VINFNVARSGNISEAIEGKSNSMVDLHGEIEKNCWYNHAINEWH